MIKNICVSLLVCMSTLAMGQRISITGVVSDSTGIHLPSATVMILNPKDSSLVNFGVTNEQGFFVIKNVPRGDYFFKVTFVGYKTYSKHLTPPASGNAIDLGKIIMLVSHTRLNEVVISETIPVTVKKDTVEYNAATFKTNKNANVEDLLKRLPGVEVDHDGNITAQGEQVKRVTVDGKDFFGGKDPKLATRNLPADAIDKVHVLDRKSDQALFSGIEDGQREKAINLELKEEKRNGAFGNFTAGYGSDDRYLAKANLNRFSKGKQFSVLGMANNTNEQGFSIDDYMTFTGSANQMRGGPVRIQINGPNQNGVPLDFGNSANGLMQTYAGGINFNNELSKQTELNGSYFYNFLDHDKLQQTTRENFLDQGSFTYNEQTQQNNINSNHRLNLMLDHKIDSVNSLRFTTNFTYNETEANTKMASQNTSAEETILSESESRSSYTGATANMNSNLLYRHKFPKKGRTFSTNLQLSYLQSNIDGLLDAIYTFENESENGIVTQRSDHSTDNFTYGATVSYTEPLGNRKYLEANYTFRQNTNDVNRPVYDLNQDHEVFNDSLSNYYNSDYGYHRGGLNFKINRKKYTMTVGAFGQQTILKGDLENSGTQIDRSFQNFLPVLRFNYDFTTFRHLRFDYETSVQEPTIHQLQPAIDNRDPLNPYKGNPSLRPAYQQSWRVNFGSFDPGSSFGFFAFLDVDYTTNAITNAVTNENFIRTTTPQNVKDHLSTYANATVTFPITKLYSRFSVSGNLRDQRGVNILDEIAYDITQRSVGGNARYNYHYKDILDINLEAQLSRHLSDYEFDQSNQKYFNKIYKAESTLTIRKYYQLNAAFNYMVYDNRSSNFHQAIPLLNISFSRFILKNNSGEIKFSVNNVLDKAIGISQTSDINYVEVTTTNSLGRYFMFSFTYALNKQLDPMGRGMRGGGMRIIR